MLAPPYQLPYPGVLGVHGLDGKLPRRSSTPDGFRALSFTPRRNYLRGVPLVKYFVNYGHTFYGFITSLTVEVCQTGHVLWMPMAGPVMYTLRHGAYCDTDETLLAIQLLDLLTCDQLN